MKKNNLPIFIGIGNVLATVSDRKFQVSDGANPPKVDYYTADICSSSDYYPFGSLMPDRNYSADSYRHGFNGMEKDDELKGNGNSYDFGARIYDSRLGRWLAVDPQAQKYSFASPYNFTLNNPIWFIDPNGEEVTIHGKDAEATKTELQKVTSLELSIDANGKLSAQLPKAPVTLSKLDIALLKAIDDKDVNVNLYTTEAEWYSSKDGSGDYPIIVGGYEGSEVINGKTETTQIFNLGMAKELEKEEIDVAGNAAAHEILESYHGGKDDPGGDYNSSYKSSHNKAKNDDDYDPKSNMYVNKNSKTGVTEYGMEKGNKKVKLTDNSKESKAKKFKK